ncbi:MAG: 1,6-anhydro-N-acetylmuramyl-L-alanine amidase AmpD, partial [Curvibacter sp.]|nr:1,6-anhydro-N-acetylmuramyl-L-alanine amidase AmpD [Curvibacter sp.]
MPMTAPDLAAGASPVWEGGWFTPARRLPSPNFGARPARAHIDLIVLHSISLPP